MVHSLKLNKNFGTVKILFDVGLVLIALILSFTVFEIIDGVREGTIISAILDGMMVKKIQ